MTKYRGRCEQVYIPRATGEVVNTPLAPRIFRLSRADPHWLYFTPSAKKSLVWSRVVSALRPGYPGALLGLFAGLSSIRPQKRSPYGGRSGWHMILGLFVGFWPAPGISAACFRMDPFPVDRRRRSRVPRPDGRKPFSVETFFRRSPPGGHSPQVATPMSASS